MDRCDLVGDIRGGDSFSDLYGMRRFLSGNLPALVAILMKRDLVLLPQTYGPFSHAYARRLASYVMAHARVILSRDRESIAVVNALLGPGSGREAGFCPDVAFTLEPAQPASLEVLPSPWGGQEAAPLVGLNVSGLLYRGGYSGGNMFGLKLDYRRFVRDLVALSLIHI